MDNLDETERINKEVERLENLFSEIDPSKKNLVHGTIKDVAFCSVMMEKLQQNILKNGTTETYQNGAAQHGTKQNPDVATYLKISQRYSSGIKILLSCFPKGCVPDDDGFENFLNERHPDE